MSESAKRKSWCERRVRNPLARWFCKSWFAQTFIYDSELPLGAGLKRSLRSGHGILFYLTLATGIALAAMLLMKQYFYPAGISLPRDAVELYLSFLGAFVCTNELDKWGTKKGEKRLFRKGENVLVMWAIVVLVAWFLDFFVGKPVPEEVGWVVKGALLAFVISKLSTVVNHYRCNGNGADEKKKLDGKDEKEKDDGKVV